MADNTHIEWADATWNPVTGCSVVSPGCTNCYAMRLAGTRLQHHWSRQGLTQDSKAGPVWTGEVRFNEPWLDQPLRWKRPRRIFVCAHGDLFHERVPDAWIDRVFAVMALAPQHIFLVLTKRAERMRAYLSGKRSIGDADICRAINQIPWQMGDRHGCLEMPLPNVWLGVSAEDQRRADERIHELRFTLAAKRFVSLEPLLSGINLTRLNNVNTVATDALRGIRVEPVTGEPIDGDRPLAPIDWVIVGGESGPGARPMHPAWARSLRDQCTAAGVPFFMKQMDKKQPIPADLLVRNFPHADT